MSAVAESPAFRFAINLSYSAISQCTHSFVSSPRAAVRPSVENNAVAGTFNAPSASVVYDENGSHVFVIRGGKAHQVAVTTGPEQDDRIAVSGEIHAGDQVAVAGAYQLQDGLAVRIAAK